MISFFFKEMLSNPILEGAVNEEAAHALINVPEIYNKMCQDCIQASIRVNGESNHIHQSYSLISSYWS